MVYDVQNSTVYKVESFSCTASTMKQFSEQLEKVINQVAMEGWKFHSFQVVNGAVCVVVFYIEHGTN